MKNELKRDPILQNIIEFVGYVKVQKQYFIQGVVLLAIVITTIGYFNSTSKANEEKATSLSGKAQNSFLDNESSNALTSLQSVLSTYSDTKASDHAAILLIQEAIRNNDQIKINEFVHQFNNNTNDPIMESSILQIKGMQSLNLENFDEAFEFYYKAARISPSDARRHQNLLSSIYCQIKLGEYKKANLAIASLLDEENIAFNEKNIAEEYQAEVQYYLND